VCWTTLLEIVGLIAIIYALLVFSKPASIIARAVSISMIFNHSSLPVKLRQCCPGQLLLSLLLFNCMAPQFLQNRGPSLIVNGEIVSIVPNTQVPSTSPTRWNSVRVPPASAAPVDSEPTATPLDGLPVIAQPTSSTSHIPTVPTRQGTIAPSFAPILNIIQTAPPSVLPSYTSASASPAQVVSRSNNDASLLMAILIPAASISFLSVVIVRSRRRRDLYQTKDHQWNGIFTGKDPPLLGAASNNQSALDNSSIYAKSSYPGRGESTTGFNDGSANSAAGWIMPRSGLPVITEEPTEVTDTDEEDDQKHIVMECVLEGSSSYCYGESAPDGEEVMATTESPSSTSASLLVPVHNMKNSRASVSKDVISNAEVALLNCRGESHEKRIQYDDIAGIDGTNNISGDEVEVNDRELLCISSDYHSIGLTGVSDARSQSVIMPIAVSNSRSVGFHPLSLLKRKSVSAVGLPVALPSHTTSGVSEHKNDTSQNLNVDYSVSAASTIPKDMPISSILHEFNYCDHNADIGSTIEPFSEINVEYGDRSVGSDIAIVNANELNLSESANPVESSSCDSSTMNVFETDNESNTSSRSPAFPSKHFQSNNFDLDSDFNVTDPLFHIEDCNISNFEQLYESISVEWEWKEPSALSKNEVQPPLSFLDSLSSEPKRSNNTVRAEDVIRDSRSDHI
jgi:hypothetical protein